MMNLRNLCVLAMVATTVLLIECAHATSSITHQQDTSITRNDASEETLYRRKRAPLGKLALLGGAALLGKKALLLGGAAVGAKALVGAGLVGAGLYKAKQYGGGGGGGYGYGYGYGGGGGGGGGGYGGWYPSGHSHYVQSSWH